MSRADLALRSRPTAVLSALEQTGGAGVCDARRLSDALFMRQRAENQKVRSTITEWWGPSAGQCDQGAM